MLPQKYFFTLLVAFLLVISVFSVYAQEADSDVTGADRATTGEIVFSEEIAGVTPDSFWYVFDFSGTVGERYHELGLMTEKADYKAAQTALENFHEAIIEETATVEAISFEGVSADSLTATTEHEGVQTLYEAQLDVLTYEDYSDAIVAVVEQQIEEGAIDETTATSLIDDVEAPVAEARSNVEEQRYELTREVSRKSGISPFEADKSYEDAFGQISQEDFQSISTITDAAEAEAKIAELEAEVAAAREA